MFRPMWTGVLVLVGLWSSPLLAATEAEGEVLEAGMVNPGAHDQPAWFKQSFLDIREDIAEADAADRRLMLYFYQDGCPYCKKLLETNFALRDIVDKTRRTVDVVSINMWGDREVVGLDGEATTEKAFAGRHRVMFTPTLLFLNTAGDVILRVNGYYAPHKFNAVLDYIGTRQETELSFRDYLAQALPAPAKGTLHQAPEYLPAPLKLAEREGDKPLLVLFEQKECGVCDELHADILVREESRALLDRFDVALVDMWSRDNLQRPDGKQQPVRDWARELNVQYAPTLVLFDAAGNEVFRAEAYLRAFHIQSVLDYVASGAYREQPNFQRFIQARAAALEAQGIHIDLMD